MDFFEKAQAIGDEIIHHRRQLHNNPEAGLRTPATRTYVMDRLREIGIQPTECGEGVIAELGSGKKMLLLRADMDALPIREESGLDFASTNGNAHCCGHDMHTAMLLGAARLLKENEAALKGKVRLMFQPGEELMEGAANMIAHGTLDPLPDAALAYHVGAGRLPVGMYLYNDRDTMMFSMDSFSVTFRGRSCHGGCPHQGVDPINMAAHAYIALQSLISRETDPMGDCVLTVGKFSGGTAPNIIPDTATMEGSIRADSRELREKLCSRLKELCECTAKLYGGSAEVRLNGGAPPLVCDGEFTREICRYMHELPVPGLDGHGDIRSSASEDFAHVLDKVPGTFIYLCAGFQDERGDAAAHSPRVLFNEDVLPIGAACMAHCAVRWLEEHSSDN